jgi:hypothetical protein
MYDVIDEDRVVLVLAIVHRGRPRAVDPESRPVR